LAAKVEEAIGRLQEYRAALITAAVTGKIDVSTSLDAGVREVAAGEPLEYPAAESTLLKAAEAGTAYGGKNAGKKNANRHGHARTDTQEAASDVRGGPCPSVSMKGAVHGA
jgi:hypothetical protein